jgi:high affinity sulfate transporter 1
VIAAVAEERYSNSLHRQRRFVKTAYTYFPAGERRRSLAARQPGSCENQWIKMDLSAALKRLPLLAQLRGYRADWLRSDIAAGLSVAAVSIPSAIAYPAIAGLPTEVGLFATIFALVGYAFVGPSRQLMVGPDAATCIMLGGVLASLSVVAPADRVAVTVTLSLAVGLLCIVAGALRLGFVANFLSRPMLVGFMAGISISLIIGQIKRLTGVSITTDGLLRPIVDLALRIGEVNLPTLVLGMATLLFLRVLRHRWPNLPAPVLAIMLGIAVSAVVDLPPLGVAVIGILPPFDFSPTWPSLTALANPDLLSGALAITVVGFGSGIVSARSFAMKNRSHVSADKELFGFGAANILSGMFGGFPVTASDSRTAVNFVVGGKTQLVALIAAGSLAVALLLISDVLALLPTATLGAILVSAAIDLIDLDELRILRRMSPAEFIFALLTLLGVVIVGVLQGVFIAIAATLAHLVWAASVPRLALLGRIPGSAGLYKLHRAPEAEAIEGLTIVVVQSALVFFNADYVKRKLLKIAGSARANGKWFILDAAAVNVLDSTGIGVLEDVRLRLAEKGIAFGISDLNTRARQMVDRAGLLNRIGSEMIFESVDAAVAAYDLLLTRTPAAATSGRSFAPA